MPRGPAKRLRQHPKGDGAAGSSVDARAAEVIARIVRLLARYGCTLDDIEQEVLKAWRAMPRTSAKSAKAPISEIDAGAHVVRTWFSDPAYLNSSGRPRPLPEKGEEDSIEALARQLHPEVDADKVLQYLRRRAVLRRVGKRFVPQAYVVSVRGTGPQYDAWSLLTLLSMLGNIEHNSLPQHSTPGWYAAAAVIPHFPVSKLQAFDQWLRRAADRFLAQTDTRLHEHEDARRRGERTVRLGVGLYRFEEKPLPRERQARRRRKQE